MQALIFLNVRQLVNGFKRTFKSARRLIGLLFGVAYYFYFFVYRFGANSQGRRSPFDPETAPKMNITMPMVEAVVFVVFTAVMFMYLLSLTNYAGRFRQADVDTLFATPIDRRVVLVSRYLRDCLLVFILPLFLWLISDKRATMQITHAVKSLPDASGAPLMIRYGMLAYLISSMAWVAVGYCVSLRLGRPDDRSDRNRRLFNYGMLAIPLIFLIVMTLVLRADPQFSTFVAAMHNPILKVVFFVPWLCTMIAMAPIAGSSVGFFAGLVGLAAIGALGLWGAGRQQEWIYEIGAMNASKTSETRDLQRKGDMYGMIAASARSGKVKARRFKILDRWNPTGLRAILWRELVIQTRVGLGLVLIAVVLGGLVLIPALLGAAAKSPDRGMVLVLLGFIMTAFISASMSTGGFIEMLRRVDVQKPLPFTPGKVMFAEVIAKSIPGTVTLLLLSAIGICVSWQTIPAFLAGFASSLPFLFALVAMFGMLLMLFPDVDDPTQRGFRSLMTMLGMLFCLTPTVIVGIAAWFISKSLVITALATIPSNLLIAYLCAHIAGGLYANLNPAE
ncbi:MAG: hypothetical protein JNM85_01770 [Chthonomonas sp.]|nr:hypothetical protein [Chthonomonas sp.]